MDLRTRLAVHEGAVTTAVVAAVAGVAGSFLLAGPTEGFVVVPVNGLLVKVMPDPLLTFSILFLGTIGEAVGFALALGTVVVLLAGTTLAALLVVDGQRTSALVAAAMGTLVAFGITGARDPSLATGVAIGLAAGALNYAGQPRVTDESRRQVLKAVGGVLGFSTVSYAVGQRAHGGQRRSLVENVDWDDERQARVRRQIEERLAEAEAASLDIKGLQGLVSPLEEFYEVDINYLDPDVSTPDWHLSVTGEVDTERTLHYDDLIAMEPEHRFVTLRCVSDPLNGKLMDNALWTGVPIKRILARAAPQGNYVVLRAQDDYYAEFPITAIEGGFLAYGINGSLLPRGHGYPVRALILGHWGEVNVKWITDIEIHDSAVLSYWEKRGWHGTGPVHPIAKLWTVNHRDDGRVQAAGFAYTGTRGIQTVEVSVDGGETWADARLSNSLGGPDTWRQWAYEWSPALGDHTVLVRTVDGNGTVQPRERQQPHPNGATGWVSKQVSV